MHSWSSLHYKTALHATHTLNKSCLTASNNNLKEKKKSSQITMQLTYKQKNEHKICWNPNSMLIFFHVKPRQLLLLRTAGLTKFRSLRKTSSWSCSNKYSHNNFGTNKYFEEGWFFFLICAISDLSLLLLALTRLKQQLGGGVNNDTDSIELMAAWTHTTYLRHSYDLHITLFSCF